MCIRDRTQRIQRGLGGCRHQWLPCSPLQRSLRHPERLFRRFIPREHLSSMRVAPTIASKVLCRLARQRQANQASRTLRLRWQGWAGDGCQFKLQHHSQLAGRREAQLWLPIFLFPRSRNRKLNFQKEVRMNHKTGDIIHKNGKTGIILNLSLIHI